MHTGYNLQALSMSSGPPSVLNIHTPTSSFAIVHSLTQELLLDLYDKLSRKTHSEYHGDRVGPGWLKYEYNDAIWNLDDDSDYTIFVWRQQQQSQGSPIPSTSTQPPPPPVSQPLSTPTLHLHNPHRPLPSAPAYVNAAYYVFQSSRVPSLPPRSGSRASRRSRSTKGHSKGEDEIEDDGIPSFKKKFERFHAGNGVRTVIGSIGPVKNVRMLLKSGYRHVYLSRKFALKHGFIPADAAPGHYGYGGLVNIGTWPITLTPVSSPTPPPSISGPAQLVSPPMSASPVPHTHEHAQSLHVPQLRRNTSRSPSPSVISGSVSVLSAGGRSGGGLVKNQSTRKHVAPQSINGHASDPTAPKPVLIQVYLSEEPHFDVVLGRSFFEKRGIKTNALDLTDVVCLDTGEKIECELVILKDGRGEIVTVT